MGYSITSILLYDASPQEIVKKVNSTTDEEKEINDLPRSGEVFVGPWPEGNVMILERDEFVNYPNKLSALSKKHQILLCSVCEGATVSECSKWEHGDLIWKISFEPCIEEGIYKLNSLNFDPAELQQISARAAKEVELYELDEMQLGFLVPIILFSEKTGFRYDDNTFERCYTSFKHVITPQ